MSKDKSNNNSNLVKSTINDQIETDNYVIEEVVLCCKKQFPDMVITL